MTTIKAGESYTHKLTGDKLKVVKLFDGMAKCETEQETVISERPFLSTKTQICNLDNLINDIMHIELKASTSTEYFELLGCEIDWVADDKAKVPVAQADAVQEILSIEASIYLTRRCTGLSGSVVDNLVVLRRKLINAYEQEYDFYIEHNNFY